MIKLTVLLLFFSTFASAAIPPKVMVSGMVVSIPDKNTVILLDNNIKNAVPRKFIEKGQKIKPGNYVTAVLPAEYILAGLKASKAKKMKLLKKR